MNVAIVEDHKILAETLNNALTHHPAIKEIRMFFGSDSFLNTPDQWNPDLIISDLLMPGMQGAELIRAYRSHLGEEIKIIVLTSVANRSTVDDVMKGGANCYMSKEESIEVLINAIHKVINGESYISDSILSIIHGQEHPEQNSPHLSPREMDVLKLICSGRIMKEVAHDLGLSIHTVQSYHNNVMRKFKVRRTSDLIIAAIRHGLYRP